MSDEILIKQCSDPMKWYSIHIGETFKRIPDALEQVGQEWKVRTPCGYLNFISFKDGEILQSK